LDNGKDFSRNFREGYRVASVDGKSATRSASTKGGMGSYSGLYGDFHWLDANRSEHLLKLASIPNKDRKILHKEKVPLNPVPIPITIEEGEFVYSQHLGQNGRIHSKISATLTCGNPGNVAIQKEGELRLRKLTTIECERLQTLPDNYTHGVAKSQRYKMIGNGFTVDVISHILKHMPEIDGGSHD
jgi:site-specific DNA-cytosine methylase